MSVAAILEVKSLAPAFELQDADVKSLFRVYEALRDSGSFDVDDIAMVFLDELIESIQGHVQFETPRDSELWLEIAESAVALQRLLLRWMGDAE